MADKKILVLEDRIVQVPAPTVAEMLSKPRTRPTGSGDDASAVIRHADISPSGPPLKRSSGECPICGAPPHQHRPTPCQPKNNHDWRVLLPQWIGSEEQWDLHLLAADQMDFLKIPEWRRYDAIAYAYSSAKAFYGNKMSFGIFMDRLRECRIPEPNKKVELDYLAEINDLVEGGKQYNDH